jgi:hypothetical protein
MPQARRIRALDATVARRAPRVFFLRGTLMVDNGRVEPKSPGKFVTTLRRVGSVCRSRLLGCCAALMLAGCAGVGGSQPEAAPAVPLPSSLGELPEGVGAPDERWVQTFGNSELVALVAEAAAANTDLATAAARIRAADARARSLSASLLPRVDAAASATRQSGSTREGSAVESDRSLQVGAHYELDFWHGARAARDLAADQARGARFDAAVVRISLEASVVVSYIGVADLRARQRALQGQLAVQTQLLELLQSRQSAGLGQRAEIAGQRAQLAAATAVLAQLRQQEQDALAALALLLGRSNMQVVLAHAELEALQQSALVGTSPAQLLLRRPDVASAEAALAAANANVAIARAALFPRVSLDLGLALQNPGFNAAVTTLQGTGVATSLAAAVVQPIFDGGRLRAERDAAVAEQQAVLAAYRGSILNALIDAQRALAASHSIDEQLKTMRVTAAQQQVVVDVQQARQSAGLGDRLALLEAQLALLQARDQLQQMQAQQLQALVAVARAFGGGWQWTGEGAQ